MVMHHIVFDAWSAELFINELSALYEAAITEQEPPFPDLPIQMADFAHWQRERAHRAAYDRSIAFWKETLSGIQRLDLPTDHPQTATLVISRINQALGVMIPVRTLFEQPSISQVASNVETLLWLTEGSAHAIDADGETGTL